MLDEGGKSFVERVVVATVVLQGTHPVPQPLSLQESKAGFEVKIQTNSLLVPHCFL